MTDDDSSSIEKVPGCKGNLRIGTWNCDRSYKINSEAIIDYCKKSECDIVALQQLYDAPSEKVVEEKDYTIYFMEPNEKKKSLAFFVKKNKVEIDGDPEKYASSDIAILNFEINGFNIQLFNFYAPPRGSPGTDRAEFYEELKKCYKTEGIKDPAGLKILCGTFNSFPNDAQTGRYDPYILREVFEKVSGNGKPLLSFLNATGTYHLNSRFHKSPERKWTWSKSLETGTPKDEAAEKEKSMTVTLANEPESSTTASSKIQKSDSQMQSSEKESKDVKSENDGFLSNRPDMVRDVDVVENSKTPHRMVYSDWDIPKKSFVTLESKLATMKLSKNETPTKESKVDKEAMKNIWITLNF